MNDRLLKACKREPVDATPVWFMRQAGRYLPEYRKIREKHDVIAICKDPELCSEVTIQPVRRLGVDAAIMFADIMLPLEGMGVAFEINEGIGPVIKNPMNERNRIESMKELDPRDDVPFVLEGIKLTRKKLDRQVPLIGFCGAPFTLASYLIEGRPTRDFVKTKSLMYRDEKAWDLLLSKLADSMTKYLQAQISAGIDVIQVFDSWVGCLNPTDYERYVLSYSHRVFKSLENSGIPQIHFGTGTSELLQQMKKAGGDVFGVDWRIPIDQAWARLGHNVAIQGNLDPAVLLGDRKLVTSQAEAILQRIDGAPGHIFNLGHGILQSTPVENAVELVKFVHSFSSSRKSSS